MMTSHHQIARDIERYQQHNTLSGFVGLDAMTTKRMLLLFVQDMQRNGYWVYKKAQSGQRENINTDQTKKLIDDFIKLHSRRRIEFTDEI